MRELKVEVFSTILLLEICSCIVKNCKFMPPPPKKKFQDNINEVHLSPKYSSMCLTTLLTYATKTKLSCPNKTTNKNCEKSNSYIYIYVQAS